LNSGNRTQEYPSSRLLLLATSGAVMLAGLWVLISMALDPRLSIVFNARGATYGGPLTWPSRALNLGALTNQGRAALFVVLMVIITAAYLAALFLVRADKRRSVTLLVTGGFLLFSLLLLFIPPLLSQDLYSYAFFGRSMTVYKANPYLLTPAAMSSDIMYELIGWKHSASVYGPVFNHLSWIVSRVAGDNVTANVLGFKTLAFAFYAACLPLIYTLTRRVSPGRENMALLMVAWSPLLLIHIPGGGHNDFIMIFFVLAGFLAFRKDHSFCGLLLVILAVMVKAMAILALAPFVVLYLRDPRSKPLRRLASAVTAIVAVPVLLYAPFWGGTGIFDSTRRSFETISFSSVPTLVNFALYRGLRLFGLDGANAASAVDLPVKVFFLALLAVISVVLLAQVKDFRSMAVATAGIALVWFLTSGYILPWYLALGLSVAVIAGWNATTGSVLAASVVFTLWRIPHSYVYLSDGLGSVLYLSVPFAIILIMWLLLQRPFPGLAGREANTVDVNNREAADE